MHLKKLQRQKSWKVSVLHGQDCQTSNKFKEATKAKDQNKKTVGWHTKVGEKDKGLKNPSIRRPRQTHEATLVMEVICEAGKTMYPKIYCIYQYLTLIKYDLFDWYHIILWYCLHPFLICHVIALTFKKFFWWNLI